MQKNQIVIGVVASSFFIILLALGLMRNGVNSNISIVEAQTCLAMRLASCDETAAPNPECDCSIYGPGYILVSEVLADTSSPNKRVALCCGP